MKKIILTGSQGFIGSYICKELLNRGYQVVGIDNYCKYGKLSRPHDSHKNFFLLEEDITEWKVKDARLNPLLQDADHFIAGAAMIGGISYFHKYAYDLLATNERILANSFDLAIKLFKKHNLKKITVLSSSMVFENATIYPTPESHVTECPPPLSTYGFQKLSSEYFCKGAFEQYGLPYTILRPFNCVGVGEDEALTEEKITSGNVELMMSHVLPDIINKIQKGQRPLHILGSGDQIRCYTNGKDIARGIVISLDHENSRNQDFNISSSEAVNVLELAERVWDILNPNEKFEYVSDSPFKYDVQKRVPNTSKAERELGFTAEISLEESILEVISYMKGKA